MNITIKIKPISAKGFRKACKLEEVVLADQIEKDTREYVPFLNGVLQKNTKVILNTIVYTADYVRYLWYGKVMVDEKGRHAVFYEGKGWRHRKGSHLHPIDKNLVFTQQHSPKAQSHWVEASYADNGKKWAEVAERGVKHFLGQ